MITFDPPLNVVVSEGKTIVVKELPLVVVDVQNTKTCFAQSAPFYKTLTLWKDADYDAAGNYTQEQAEAKFLELLGSDPATKLAELYAAPAPKAE